jgi:hypothetical protein
MRRAIRFNVDCTSGLEKPHLEPVQVRVGEASGSQVRLDIEVGEERDDHLTGGRAFAHQKGLEHGPWSSRRGRRTSLPAARR